MLCWGSWANTQKLAGKTWRYELFYWDYVIGILLFSIVLGFTLGSMGDAGRSFVDDLGQITIGNYLSAFIGGAIFNLANILLSAAVSMAGLAVAFPLGVGIALVLGVFINYFGDPKGDATMLFFGVALVMIAIILNAMASGKMGGANSGTNKKGAIVAILAGVLMSFFYRFVAAAMDLNNFESPTPGMATPYSAFFIFSVGIFVSNFLFNALFLTLALMCFLPIIFIFMISITDNNVKRKATKLVGTIYADATVSSWEGSGDALDIYYFDMTEDCNFSLSLSELDKNAKVKLYYDYGDGSYGSIISTTVRAARGLSFADTLEQGTYYLEIASYDNGGGRYNTGYTLELEKEIDGVSTRLSLESDSPFTDNNTKETATELELVPSTDAVITSWVGAGDALDYYSFNVEQAGTLSLCLSELEKNATVRLFQATEAGYQQTLSTTVRAARGLDTELTLATGTYFLEIASYDNGAGRYNTTYALELEKEEDGETKRYAIAGSGL